MVGVLVGGVVPHVVAVSHVVAAHVMAAHVVAADVVAAHAWPTAALAAASASSFIPHFGQRPG